MRAYNAHTVTEEEKGGVKKNSSQATINPDTREGSCAANTQLFGTGICANILSKCRPLAHSRNRETFTHNTAQHMWDARSAPCIGHEAESNPSLTWTAFFCLKMIGEGLHSINPGSEKRNEISRCAEPGVNTCSHTKSIFTGISLCNS